MMHILSLFLCQLLTLTKILDHEALSPHLQTQHVSQHGNQNHLWQIGFLYIPPDKADFFSCINYFCSQFNTLDTQKCYVLMGFNINLLFKCNEIFSNKIAETASEEMLFRFFYSLEQITTTPTGTADRTATLSHKVSQFRLFFRSLAHTLHTKGITTKVA